MVNFTAGMERVLFLHNGVLLSLGLGVFYFMGN